MAETSLSQMPLQLDDDLKNGYIQRNQDFHDTYQAPGMFQEIESGVIMKERVS